MFVPDQQGSLHVALCKQEALSAEDQHPIHKCVAPAYPGDKRVGSKVHICHVRLHPFELY
jgi:hypothetical protein